MPDLVPVVGIRADYSLLTLSRFRRLLYFTAVLAFLNSFCNAVRIGPFQNLNLGTARSVPGQFAANAPGFREAGTHGAPHAAYPHTLFLWQMLFSSSARL